MKCTCNIFLQIVHVCIVIIMDSVLLLELVYVFTDQIFIGNG